MFGQNWGIAVMCTLVKFRVQFVYILVRIEIPSNRALKEQVKEKQTYHHLQLKFKLEIYKTISEQPQNTLVKFT
jgi:hypothetical protein